MAQHRVCVLLTAVWVVLPKLDLESELELDSIESQDLFLELVMDSGFHFLQKGSYINAWGGGLQGYPSANLAGSCRLPMAFCRRQARVSALFQTPPESLAGSPGLFESPEW